MMDALALLKDYANGRERVLRDQRIFFVHEDNGNTSIQIPEHGALGAEVLNWVYC